MPRSGDVSLNHQDHQVHQVDRDERARASWCPWCTWWWRPPPRGSRCRPSRNALYLRPKSGETRYA